MQRGVLFHPRGAMECEKEEDLADCMCTQRHGSKNTPNVREYVHDC